MVEVKAKPEGEVGEGKARISNIETLNNVQNSKDQNSKQKGRIGFGSVWNFGF